MLTEEHKKKISLANTGRKLTDQQRLNLSKALKGRKVPKIAGENHVRWKGDKVSYSGLHYWVYKNLGFPTKCENCGFQSENHRKIHWANKSGKYLRKIEDWIRLCVPCHSKHDKKIKNKL